MTITPDIESNYWSINYLVLKHHL